MTKSPEKLVEELKAATAAARQVLADIRGVQKDLRQLSADQAREMAVLRTAVEKRADEMVVKEVAQVRELINDWMKNQQDSINELFAVVRQDIVAYSMRISHMHAAVEEDFEKRTGKAREDNARRAVDIVTSDLTRAVHFAPKPGSGR